MSGWSEVLGLASALPPLVVAAIALIVIYGLIVFPSAAAMTYLQRKLVAGLQGRVGPNRMGPRGAALPLTDFFKLLQKNPVPFADWREAFWSAVQAMTLYSTVGVLPLGSTLILVDTEMSAILPFWAALVLGLGTMYTGFAQGSVPGWFGGVRIASQALAAAVPSLLCLLAAALRSGGLSWTGLSGAQGAGPWAWGALSNPFQAVAFVTFVLSGMVLLSLPPFDAGRSSTDLQGGVATDLSGSRLALYRLGCFYGFFMWCLIAVVLFLGAWNVPVFFSQWVAELGAPLSARVLAVVEACVLMIKTFAVMLVITWLNAANARVRVDQVTDLTWKVLAPLALFSLTGAAIWEVLL